jgi:hypothetical protein
MTETKSETSPLQWKLLTKKRASSTQGLIEALNPRAVIAGHKVPENDDDPKNIEETRRYIRDFIRLNDSTQTARELYDRMLELYPDRVNPGSLWGSANAAKAS